MNSETSFKSRVRDVIVENAETFYSTFVEFDYLIFSDAFDNNEYYIISACEDNYKHLTGVHSELSAGEFFAKCLNQTLTEDDFDFIKIGQEEKTVKGSVRRKIGVLPNIGKMFNCNVLVEEDYEKNYVKCSFAVADSFCTLGFIDVGTARPNTLLKNNTLDSSKARPLELVMRKKRHQSKFVEVIVGSPETRDKYASLIDEVNGGNFQT